MDNLFENQTDANETEVSSEPQNNSQETLNASESTQTPEANTEKTPEFHEHPRFKELIEDRNSMKEALAESKRQYEDLQRMVRGLQASQAPQAKPKNADLEELRSIKPELASYIEKIGESTSKIEQLEAQLAESRNQTLVDRYTNAVKELYSTNKVSSEMQPLYDSLIRASVMQSNARLDQVPSIFNKVHADMSKLVDGIKRSTTAEYSQGKKKDASAPKPMVKGATPTKGDFKYSTDEVERRDQMIQRILSLSKASNSV